MGDLLISDPTPSDGWVLIEVKADAIGVDDVVIDDGEIDRRVRAIVPDGLDAALELIGTPTLPEVEALT